MTAYQGQTRLALGQSCAALFDSHSQPDVMQPGFEPGTAVMPLALKRSVLDRCVTRESKPVQISSELCLNRFLLYY